MNTKTDRSKINAIGSCFTNGFKKTASDMCMKKPKHETAEQKKKREAAEQASLGA